ncbi:IS110 family transposase [Mesorhizobium sp. M0276]|uniref:IS110 family transposase n=1 Tax=Mesorhizobium sp. M0276 TaxID=2956928 RepID=UPI00333CA41B
MGKVTIIGVDLAKNVFQLHGAAADGNVVFRKKLSCLQFCRFMEGQPACVVAMEACAGSHYWAREMVQLGHQPKLIAPRYVKAFIKRQKNDAADAEAIVEAAQRPTMRFVEMKTEEQQSRSIMFRTREQLVNHRTELVNALRAHLYEFGHIAPQGIRYLSRLERFVEDENANLPDLVREICRDLLDQIYQLTGRIDALAIETFAPPMETFKCGRDFAAWLGLVPLQRSTGGKQRLGKTSKMGQRDIRRLLMIGAMAVIRWASRKGAPEGSWLARMMAKKPRMLVAVALANKMARGIWAMLTKEEDYRNPATVPA